MDGLDGLLLVPPDRSQILGRAMWKVRYVVVGRRTVALGKEHQSVPSYSQLMTTSRINAATKPAPRLPNEDFYISVYKTKDDLEPLQQWPLSCVTDCQVQSVAHRKQGPVLPTLVISVSDKERKRRSSRATGFMTANKESSSSPMLWFRTPPDDHHISLHEWARFIVSKKSPMSPDSPASPVFSNPFSPRSREAPEYFPRPNSGKSNNRSDARALHHKSSTATYSTGTRERPMTFSSGSPSLRSKRSDVSTSTNNHPLQNIGYSVPGQHYASAFPTDIPSPITSIGEYKGELIEGWTSAQGRSSTMSSPVHGRDSLSSHAPQPPLTESSSPPAPRETILDRAFQLNCIPGSDREVAGEEKLTSLARFDALMREVDEKRSQREAAERARHSAIRSAFEADDSSDEGEAPIPADLDDTDSDDDNYVHEQDVRAPQPLIPPTAKRALEFIAGQEAHKSPISPRPAMSRTPLSFHADQMPIPLMQASAPARPHTSHGKTRPQRPKSTSQAARMTNRFSSQDMPALSSKPSEDGTLRPSGDKRQSSSSTKRLSFTEFTKRLSSTSSLLLVQTNTSGGSSRGSSEVDIRPSSVIRTNLNPRGTGPPPPRDRERDDTEKPCGWRGSVGVIGTEGGFL